MQIRNFFSRTPRLLLTFVAGALLHGAVPHVAAQAAVAPQTAGSARAGTTSSVKATEAAPRAIAGEQSESAAPSDASHLGIKMHGHWIIDVKNADGTLAEHRDFQNSILVSGETFLIQLMQGAIVPSDYAIDLEPNSGQNAPCVKGGNQSCTIVRSMSTNPGGIICPIYACVTGLTYGFLTTGNYPSMTLSGSVTATQAGSVGIVRVIAGSCPGSNAASSALSTVSPATCNVTDSSSAGYQMSGTNITPVTVVASQIIQVTVVITFS